MEAVSGKKIGEINFQFTLGKEELHGSIQYRVMVLLQIYCIYTTLVGEVF